MNLNGYQQNYKEYYEFKRILTESGYNRMKDFNKLLISFKSLRTKKIETQLKKEPIMKNIDELYKNCYDACKSNYDADDDLGEDKKKKIDYKQFELGDEINKESKLDEKTEELKLAELPKWLSSKNDFNKARKLINNIRADTNKVKSSSSDEKVFNDLNKLINDIQNKKTTRKSATKQIRNIIFDFD